MGGVFTHNIIACVPDDLEENSRQIAHAELIASELKESFHAQYFRVSCPSCSTEAQLDAALNVIRAVDLDGTTHKELENMRMALTKVDQCLAVYRRTIDKKTLI